MNETNERKKNEYLKIWLTEFMNYAGLDENKVAEITGKNRNTVKNWLAARTEPELSDFLKIIYGSGIPYSNIAEWMFKVYSIWDRQTHPRPL